MSDSNSRKPLTGARGSVPPTLQSCDREAVPSQSLLVNRRDEAVPAQSALVNRRDEGAVSSRRAAAVSLAAGGAVLLASWLTAAPAPQTTLRSELYQSQEDADRKSAGCVSCHGLTEAPSMHPSGTVHLACVDCHGGNSDVRRPPGADANSASYKQAEKQAHPRPRLTDLWKSSANPVRAATAWLREDK